MLQNLLASIHYLGYEKDTDFIDRAHAFVTTNLLITFAILVSFKQFGGTPIECMVPDTFSTAMEQYTESFCWSRDNYFLPFDEEIPLTKIERSETEISYYQWVPFYLLFQALCFRFPALIWKYLSVHSGLRIRDIVNTAVDPNNMHLAARQNNLDALSRHVQNALKFHRLVRRRNQLPHKHAKCLNLPYSAFYVTSLYLFVKIMFLVNVIFQLWAMNRFLMTGSEKSILGFQTVGRLMNGTGWELSGVFPRVTLCDIQLFSLENKAFRFVLLMLATTVSFIYWLCLVTVPYFALKFITKHLEMAEIPMNIDDEKDTINRFVGRYLSCDGVFVLRMVHMHTDIIFANDLIKSLWSRFKNVDEICSKMIATDSNHSVSMMDYPDVQHQSNVKQPESILKNPLIRNRLIDRIPSNQQSTSSSGLANQHAISSTLIESPLRTTPQKSVSIELPETFRSADDGDGEGGSGRDEMYTARN